MKKSQTQHQWKPSPIKDQIYGLYQNWPLKSTVVTGTVLPPQEAMPSATADWRSEIGGVEFTWLRNKRKFWFSVGVKRGRPREFCHHLQELSSLPAGQKRGWLAQGEVSEGLAWVVVGSCCPPESMTVVTENFRVCWNLEKSTREIENCESSGGSGEQVWY